MTKLSTPDYLTKYLGNLNYREVFFFGFPYGDYSINKYGELEMSIDSIGKTAIIPKQFYKGYVVELYDDDNLIKSLTPHLDDYYGNLLEVSIPEENQFNNYKFVTYYKGTTLQKLSMVISLISIISIAVCEYKKRSAQ